MCQHRRPKSGMKFFSDGCTTDLISSFEHERLISGLGQVKRGDQSVMPAADNDDVARVRHCSKLGSPLWPFLCKTLCSLWSVLDSTRNHQKLNHRGHRVSQRKSHRG